MTDPSSVPSRRAAYPRVALAETDGVHRGSELPAREPPAWPRKTSVRSCSWTPKALDTFLEGRVRSVGVVHSQPRREHHEGSDVCLTPRPAGRRGRPAGRLVAGPAAADDGGQGAVYTLTNRAAGDAVAVFERAADGSLKAAGEVPTGGLGTGGGLGNQGALALDDGGDFLFAVNAGSNDISVLRTRPGGLTLVDRVASGGVSPISLTVSGDLLYALNAGSGSAPGSISRSSSTRRATSSSSPRRRRTRSAPTPSGGTRSRRVRTRSLRTARRRSGSRSTRAAG